MANWSNPTLTSSYTNFVTEVKDRDVEVALWFEGMSPTNLPTNAKRLNTSTGRFEKWNGSAWVDAVGTFTFPAMSVAGTSTFTGVATFTANPVMNGGTANGVPYLNGSKELTSGSALTFDGNTLKSDIASTTAANIRIENGSFNRVGSFSLTVNGVQFDSFDQNNVTAQRSYKWLSGGLEVMHLTSAGLGLGVTPSVWSGAAFELQTGAALYGFSNTTNLVQNAYYNAGWKYKATGAVALAQVARGAHYWFTAPSGTAGNPITFTQAMTLDVNGRLFIGQTVDKTQEVLRVSGSGQASLLLDNTGKTNGAFAGIFNDAACFGVSRNPSTGVFYNTSNYAAEIVAVGSSSTSYILFGTSTAANTTPTERARFDPSGNLIAHSSVTGHWQLPNGTTAQRPTGAAGMIRFNTSLTRYEGHNGTAWSSIGGGATGGGSDDIFYENGQTVTTNYTLTSNKNAMSAGPITIASGITVTVPSGGNWVVV